jgi:hypothetical protein
LLVPPLPASSNQHAFQNVKLIMLAWMNECPSSFCLIWHRITLHSKNCITCLGFEALAKFDNCKPFWQKPWSIHSFQVADFQISPWQISSYISQHFPVSKPNYSGSSKLVKPIKP